MSEDARADLILKLKEVFRSDRSDLDFGIYRILDLKRKEIERFIEEDLVKEAESEFSELVKANFEEQKAELNVLREEINRDFGEETIDSMGEVTRLHDAPKIKVYSELKQTVADQERARTQICEVFNHVYEFFNRYYDKGDFISRRLLGGREKYVIPYNGEEVSLYWVNHDQYYVKTSEDYQKYSFMLSGYQVILRLVDVETEKNNIGDDSFFVIHRELPVRFDEEDDRLNIFFERRPLREEDLSFYEIGKSSHQNTKFDAIVERDYRIILASLVNYPDLIKQVKSSKHGGEESELKHHLMQYYKKNDMDYFIHKRLGNFLRQELDFYIKNEVQDVDETLSKDARNIELMQLKIGAIKKISERTIAFLESIEDFQKNLFEKKKFVLQTDYCITLDLVPKELYSEIADNMQQVAEWKQICCLDMITEETLQGTSTKGKSVLDSEFLEQHKHLMLDTKHFSDQFKLNLLNHTDNIDDSLNGLIIKSDNYHALSLISEKYEGKITCLYIDPPFNTGNDGFIYKDKYQHSSWISMVYDRMKIAQSFMNESGIQFISINDIECDNLRKLMTTIVPKDSFIGPIIWKSRQNIDNRTLTGLSNDHEYILCYGERIRGSERDLSQYSNPDNDPRGDWSSANMVGLLPESQRPNCHFDLIDPDTGINYGKPEMGWRVDKNTMGRLIREKRIIWPKSPDGRPRRKVFLNELKSEFTGFPSIIKEKIFTYHGTNELNDYFGEKVLLFPKPTNLIKLLIEQTEKNNSTVLDFFSGSGTTADAVLRSNKSKNQSRKFVLIEAGDQFETLILPRLKKLAFTENWKDGRPLDYNGQSVFFKYQYIEQYEDTLNNIIFSEKDGLAQTTLHKLPDYFMQHLLNVETRDSPTRLTIDRFKTPFDYKIRTLQGKEEKSEPVDLVETFNYLLGIKLKKIRQCQIEQTKYIIVYGEKGEEPSCTKVLIIWRNFNETILDKERQFIEEEILPEYQPDTIYVNVDSLIKGAESIEPKFKELMGP